MATSYPIPRYLSEQCDFPTVDRPRERFALFSQQRSGSTWLAARLTNLGQFGWVHEYLERKHIRVFSDRLGVPRDAGGGVSLTRYLEAVERVRTSPNGRFGTKVQPNQLELLFGGDRDRSISFMKRFDRIVVLTRDDKVAQAVSGAISEASGEWVTRGADPDISNVPLETVLRDVADKLHRYVQEEVWMVQVCEGTGRPWMQLSYEELFADAEAGLARVAGFLGWQPGSGDAAEVPNSWVTEPPPGRVHAELRRRFLDFIEGRRAQALAGRLASPDPA